MFYFIESECSYDFIVQDDSEFVVGPTRSLSQASQATVWGSSATSSSSCGRLLGNLKYFFIVLLFSVWYVWIRCIDVFSILCYCVCVFSFNFFRYWSFVCLVHRLIIFLFYFRIVFSNFEWFSIFMPEPISAQPIWKSWWWLGRTWSGRDRFFRLSC